MPISAIRALREAAVDYLLQPVGEDTADALFRIERRFARKKIGTAAPGYPVEQSASNSIAGSEPLRLPTNFGFHCLRVDEIRRCESDGNWHDASCCWKPILICRTMKEFEDLVG